jgi:hypothetical protein
MKIMDLQTRKLNFIQEVLTLSSEKIIGKLENVLHKEKKQVDKKSSFYDLVGVISEEEAIEMEKEIEAACEQIHEDDWK